MEDNNDRQLDAAAGIMIAALLSLPLWFLLFLWLISSPPMPAAVVIEQPAGWECRTVQQDDGREHRICEARQ